MKRLDNKWSTIYLLSSFLVHHKSKKVSKALSNTKSNATIRTPCSHSKSSKVTGFTTAQGTLQAFFVWYPVNKVSSWQSCAAIQRTATWSPLSSAVISNQTCYYLLLEGYVAYFLLNDERNLVADVCVHWNKKWDERENVEGKKTSYNRLYKYCIYSKSLNVYEYSNHQTQGSLLT